MNHTEILQRDRFKLRALGFDPERSPDPDVQFAWQVFESYQRAGEFHQLTQFVPPDQVSIDVGANLGYYSIKLAALSKAVLSIEPVQELNWLARALPANCTFINCAAGEREQTLTLHTPIIAGQPQLGMSSLIEKPVFGVFEFVQQTTTLYPLDQLVEEHFPNQKIGFIKLDVEGYERQVVRGADAILKRDRPYLQVEVAPEDVENMTAFFARRGYQGCFFFNGRRLEIAQYEPAIHHAAPDWEADTLDTPQNLQVDNFFFTPINSG